MIYNRKQMKTASKAERTSAKRKFRLEETVRLAATDRHSDSYRMILTARPLRDVFNIHLEMIHEPSYKLVFTKSWLFKTEKRCRDTFSEVLETITDVRDFVETEGLKTVTAQYMIKHRLIGIDGDIDDMYNNAILYVRPDKWPYDNSSNGNLLHNHPLIPHYVQSGEDSLHDVWNATGAFPNPVKTSSSQDRMTKTSELITEKVSDFLAKIVDSVKSSIRDGRRAVVKRYMDLSKASEDEAEGLYESIRSSMENKVYMTMSADDLVEMMSVGAYVPKEKAYNRKSALLNKALGVDCSPVRATASDEVSGVDGELVVVISPDPDTPVGMSGKMDRILSPEDSNYTTDPISCLYPFDRLSDCRATAAMLGLTPTDVMRDPVGIVQDSRKVQADVLVFGPIRPENVLEVVAGNPEDAGKVRRILNKLGKILPVATSSGQPVCSREAEVEDVVSNRPAPEMQHFRISDRVQPKRLNNPSLKGTISDMSNGLVTVQWDDGNRHVYDLVEALSRLGTISEETVEGDYRQVAYRLPGMDEDTILTLNSCQIDPVTVHSLVSHSLPSSDKMGGWSSSLLRSFSKLGLDLRRVRGYRYSEDGEEAFSKHNWYESKLPMGAGRLILDVQSPKDFRIVAGEADDYVSAPMRSVQFE